MKILFMIVKIVFGLIVIPGECVPKFSDVESRINQKIDDSYEYPNCAGEWSTNDFINFTPNRIVLIVIII